MKIIKVFILAFTLCIPFVQFIFSQTNGKLIFTVSTTSSIDIPPTGNHSPLHVVAIWIEDNSGNFIKTKIKNCSSTTIDHLGIWYYKSGQNVIDALTGPTLTSHGPISFEWNGINVAGTLVSDGIYNIWIEMAWADSKTIGKTSTSFSFTKGPNSFYNIPAGTSNFSGISLNWIPNSPLSIENNSEAEYIRVYPNPATDIINLDFSHAASNCRIKILNVTGSKIYEESSEYLNSGIKTIDLSRYSNGIYFINVESSNKLSIFRVIKNK
jgi:hypothetical protein